MKKTLLYSIFFLFTGHLFAQNIYRVKETAVGNNNGLDWENAFNDLQTALSIANTGDEIWVAKGTYYPDAGADREQSFYLKNGVKLYGGFSGSENQLDARNISQNPTVLSGNIGNKNVKTDNTRHVVRALGVNAQTVLDGFIVEGGYADGDFGGGMYIAESNNPYSKPVITDCIFRNNFAEWGGAVYISGTFIDPTITRCLFERNYAFTSGGAILHAAQNTGVNDTFQLRDCQFIANRTSLLGNGGALYCENMYNFVVSIKNCLFERDTSGGGGAIANLPATNATFIIDSCVFKSNWAANGACFDYNTVVLLTDVSFSLNLFVNKCIFRDNFANSGGSGLKIDISDATFVHLDLNNCLASENYTTFTFLKLIENSKASVEIKNSIFNQNTTSYASSLQTGSAHNELNTRFVNCLFSNNQTAIRAINNTPNNKTSTTVQHCTFYKNKDYTINKNTFNVYNLGLDSFYNNLFIENSVLWQPDFGISDILYNYNSDTAPFFTSHGKGIFVRHSYLSCYELEAFGLQLGQFDESVIYKKYPEFVDTLTGDYRLKPCSPLVNQGDNEVPWSLQLATDLNGLNRIANDSVDMGAYEQPATCVSSTATPATIRFLKLYPNPSSDTYFCASLEEPISKNGVLEVYNPYGQLIHRAAINRSTSNDVCEHIGTAAPGWYKITLRFPDKTYTGSWLKVE